jgi:hypothetical protein
MSSQPKRPTSQAANATGPEGVWARIEGFHRMMVGLLRELEATTDPVRIRDLVGALDQGLPGHFADEVGPGGLFDDLAARRPASEPMLAYLRNDHEEILVMVRALHQRLADSDADPAGILQGKRDLLERLRSHEQHENRLVMDTYRFDEGGMG